MLLTEVPPSLVETLSSGRLVLFAGAGISKGSNLPTGRELALQMQTELFSHKFVSKRPSTEDPLQLSLVAQNYQTAFGRQRLNELLQTIFNREGLSPNDAHRTAVKLFNRIITTNYDSLFEDATKQSSKSPVVIVRDVHVPSASLPNRTIIYKLHGDLTTPDRIVITQRDYSRIPLHDGLRTELRSFLLTAHLLFVGYALGDPDLVFQIEFCRELLGTELPKSYAVLPGVEKDQLFIKQCDGDNIDLLSFPALEFLQELDNLLINFHPVPSSPSSLESVHAAAPKADATYRSVVREEFKWIDFKGIPVLGGQLRIPIDELFVPLSGMVSESPQPEAAKTQRDAAPRSARKRQVTLFAGLRQQEFLRHSENV